MIDKATQPNHELLNFLSRTTSFLCAGIRTFTYDMFTSAYVCYVPCARREYRKTVQCICYCYYFSLRSRAKESFEVPLMFFQKKNYDVFHKYQR